MRALLTLKMNIFRKHQWLLLLGTSVEPGKNKYPVTWQLILEPQMCGSLINSLSRDVQSATADWPISYRDVSGYVEWVSS